MMMVRLRHILTEYDTTPTEILLASLTYTWGLVTLSPRASLNGSMWDMIMALAPEPFWAGLAMLLGLGWLCPLLRGGWYHIRQWAAFTTAVFWFGLAASAVLSRPESTFIYQMFGYAIAAAWCSWRISRYWRLG